MEKKLWRVHHPEEPFPSAAVNEDDDVIMDGFSDDLAPNAKCPITMVDVCSHPITCTAVIK